MKIRSIALLALPTLLAVPLLSSSVRADGLGLTDDQVSKVQEARKARNDAVKPLREQLKADLEKLRSQVEGKASDAEIQGTLERMKEARKGIEAAAERFRASMEATLNPTQRAKMLLGLVQRVRNRGAGGKGGKSGSTAP